MKKKFPKIWKKLQSFLTDESGKITKKDALGISLATFLWVNIADAATTHSSSTHTNWAGQWWGTWHSSYAHGNNQSCAAPNHTSSLWWHNSFIWWSKTVKPTHSDNFSVWSMSWHWNATGHSSHWSHSSHGSSWGGCFTFEQRVLTQKWYKAIGLLNVWDEVISYDHDKNQYTTSIIDKKIIHDGLNDILHDYNKYPLIKVNIMTEDWEFISIQTTNNHPFYCENKSEYIHIWNIEVDENIFIYNNKWKILSKSILIDCKDLWDFIPTVYNLHMRTNDNHNYFVEWALVHNAEWAIKKN